MVGMFWRGSDLSITTKVDLMVSCVFSRLLCAAETWTLKAEDTRRLLAFETRCYRRRLKISWMDRITNKGWQTFHE